MIKSITNSRSCCAAAGSSLAFVGKPTTAYCSRQMVVVLGASIAMSQNSLYIVASAVTIVVVSGVNIHRKCTYIDVYLLMKSCAVLIAFI